MATERTPEERRYNYQARVRAREIIDETQENLVSWKTADRLDEPPDVCDLWVNRIWDSLRVYDKDDLIQAIIILIEDDCEILDWERDANT